MQPDAFFTITCVLIYVAVGIAATRLTYILTSGSLLKIFLSSMVCSLFFSAGLAFGRLPVPVPTAILICVWIYDLITQGDCIQTTEDGCVPQGEEEALIVIPFLAQWLVWFFIFFAIYWVRNLTKSRSA